MTWKIFSIRSLPCFFFSNMTNLLCQVHEDVFLFLLRKIKQNKINTALILTAKYGTIFLQDSHRIKTATLFTYTEINPKRYMYIKKKKNAVK